MDTIDGLLKSVEEKILERGREYYESGKIESIFCDGSGNFTAKVEGSEMVPYKVQVSLDPGSGEVLSYGCGCPYEFGDICKHLVAVFLAIQNGNYEREQGISPDNFTQCVESLSVKQLREMIISHAETDDAFRNEILLASGYLKDPQALSSVKKQIREAVRAGTHRGFIDWRGCDEICGELDRLLNSARDRLEGKKPLLAFRITLEIVRTGVRLASEADSSSGSLTDVMNRGKELLGACCKAIRSNGTEKEKKQCLDRLMKVSQEKRFDGWEEDAYSLLHMAVCFLTGKDSAKWYALLDAMQKKAESRDFSDYSLEENALLRMESIARLEGKDAAKNYLYANLKWDRLRKIAVEHAMKEKNYVEAERLCLGKLSSQERFQRADWLEFLYRIYGCLQDPQKQADTAENLLLTGNLDYFDQLKKLRIADGTWKKKYPELLNTCREKLSVWQYQCLLKHAGESRMLMDTVKKYPESVFEYGPELALLFPTEIFPIYNSKIREFAETADSRPQYKKVCGKIGEMYRAGGCKTAEQLISTLMQAYPRRSAFLDELSKLKKKLSAQK